jgi:hypothetical protein
MGVCGDNNNHAATPVQTGLGNGYKQGVKKYCITRIEHSELSHEKGQQLMHPKYWTNADQHHRDHVTKAIRHNPSFHPALPVCVV